MDSEEQRIFPLNYVVLLPLLKVITYPVYIHFNVRNNEHTKKRGKEQIKKKKNLKNINTGKTAVFTYIGNLRGNIQKNTQKLQKGRHRILNKRLIRDAWLP